LEKTHSKIFKSFAAVILVITMNLEFKTPKYDFDKFILCFEQTDKLIKKSKNTLNSPDNVSIMIAENKPVYNSGLSEYFYTKKDTSGFKISSSVEASERMEEFQKEIDEKIIRKEFDLILLTKGYYSFFVKNNLLYQNYKLTGSICTPFIDYEMETETWVPKE
jgi:hypothetical protein